MITLAGAVAYVSGIYLDRTDWAGEPHIDRLHAVSAALHDPTDDAAEIAGMLSGALKDTDTTIGVLMYLGVSEQVIEALKAVTKKPNERFIDWVHRANADPLGRKLMAAMLAADWAEARLTKLDRDSAAFLRGRRDEALGILTVGRRAA